MNLFVVFYSFIFSGFGTVDGRSDMWLGNDKIHALTSQDTELLIQLQDADGNKRYAIYSDFRLADEKARYRFSLGIGFSGNLDNSFTVHRDTDFVTLDSDPDGNCSVTEGGGWWFKQCGDVLLNSNKITWRGFGASAGGIIKTEMKIRRKKGKTLIGITAKRT